MNILMFIIYSYILIYSSFVQICDFTYFRLFEWDLNDAEHVESFDFVVVGGGSAGAVVAHYLSKNHRVLLLEAGGNPHPLVSVPAMSVYLSNHPSGDWLHKTVPQEKCCQGLLDHRVPIPRGKMLGGSSSINYMIYNRGHPKDFDNWANITGDPSWLHENIIQYFRKYEDYHGNFKQDGTHSIGGPARIEKLKFEPAVKYWLDGAQELGFKIKDLNHFQEPGFSPIDSNTRSGARASTFKGFLEPILGRKNLVIYRYSQATKIHLDKNKRADGVYYERHGIKKFVRASKEVIISGGTMESPRLLILSGIGPQEHLKSLKIKPNVLLPVGKNLQDHVITAIGPFLVNDTVSFNAERDSTFSQIQDYKKDGSGFLQFAGLTGSAVTSSSLAEDPSWPDIFYFFLPVSVTSNTESELESLTGFRPGYWGDYNKPYIGKDSFMGLVSVGRPKSIGEILLTSRNPRAPLLIDPKYFSHPDDINVMVEGVKLIVKLFETTKSFQKLGTKLVDEPIPGCEKFIPKTDEYWRCYVKYYTFNLFHQAGTCRMGKSNDPNSVLDSKLRVLGVSGLRVIDASIMPMVTNANTNAPTIMIGEKGSAMIREYWAEQYKICDKFNYVFNSRDHPKCYYSQLS